MKIYTTGLSRGKRVLILDRAFVVKDREIRRFELHFLPSKMKGLISECFRRDGEILFFKNLTDLANFIKNLEILEPSYLYKKVYSIYFLEEEKTILIHILEVSAKTITKKIINILNKFGIKTDKEEIKRLISYGDFYFYEGDIKIALMHNDTYGYYDLFLGISGGDYNKLKGRIPEAYKFIEDYKKQKKRSEGLNSKKLEKIKKKKYRLEIIGKGS